MIFSTPSAEMDDPNVREDVAGCCDAWAEASDRCGLPKRAAAMRDLALELRRPSDPVRAEIRREVLAEVGKIVRAQADMWRESPLRYATCRNIEEELRALARAEAGSPRPTSTRREVLEEAARKLEEIDADLLAIRDRYIDSQSSGRFDNRRIHADAARRYAHDFAERADATRQCARIVRSLASEGE